MGSRRGSEASDKMVKVEAPLSSSGGEEGEESDEEGWDEESELQFPRLGLFLSRDASVCLR